MTEDIPPRTPADKKTYDRAITYLDTIEALHNEFEDTNQHDRKTDLETIRKLTTKENLEPELTGLTTPINREELEGIRSWIQRTQSTKGNYKEDPIFAEWPSNKYVDALNTIHDLLIEKSEDAVTIEGEWYDSEYISGYDYKTTFSVMHKSENITVVLSVVLKRNGVFTTGIKIYPGRDDSVLRTFTPENTDRTELEHWLWGQIIVGSHAIEMSRETVLSRSEAMAFILDRAGHPNDYIARVMGGISRSTVGTHLQRVRQKRTEAPDKITRLQNTVEIINGFSVDDLEDSSISL